MAAAHRLRSGAWSTIWATPCRPTRTSRRRSSRGFDPHYDVHDVFVLQTSGHKHWTVHEPVHADPLASQPWTDHRDAIAQRVKDEPVIDTVLSPGDALYLPRGWVHSARALGALSIHLTIGVSTSHRHGRRSRRRRPAGKCCRLQKIPAHGHRPDRPERNDGDGDQDHCRADRDDARSRVRTSARMRRRDWRSATQTGRDPSRSGRWHLFEAAERAATTRVRWRHGLVATIRLPRRTCLLRLPDRTMSFPESCADAVAALHRGLVVDASSTARPGHRRRRGADSQTPARGGRGAGRPGPARGAGRRMTPRPIGHRAATSRWHATIPCTARPRRASRG